MSDSKGSRFLSELVLNRTYAATLPTGVKETKEQVIDRVLSHHVKRYPSFANEILGLRTQLVEGKVVPAMRWMQFAGEGIERCNVKGFNCSYTTIESFRDLAEIFFILMCGTGVGYSVRRRHVSRLPIVNPGYTDRVTIEDSKEGWADSVLTLMQNLSVKFDYSLIRPAGAALSTGGTASGPEPLRHMHELMRAILLGAVGRKLKPIEVHDLVCIISDAVVVGGVRRAALISIFDPDDDEMLRAKHGNWWETHPWRARANNSAALLHKNPNSKQQFETIMQRCYESNAGEPGIFWTDDEDWGTNPCKPLRSLILTPEGYITFEEALKKDKLVVYTPDGRRVSASKPFLTGKNREVFRIQLSNGMYLYGTDNHQHQLQNGEWKEVKDLKVGDRLAYRVEQRISLSIDDVKEYEQGLLIGWLHGDGWNFERDNNSHRAGLCFGPHEDDTTQFFEELLGRRAIPHSQKPDTCKILRVHQPELGGYSKTTDLGWLRTQTSDFKLGFIRAMFTADGSVRRANNVELYSVHREWLETINLVLQEFGVRSTVTVHGNEKSYTAVDGLQRNNKTCYKLNVYAGQFKRIGFICKYKQDLLEKQDDKGLYRRTDYETVQSIELDSVEDVYDITVYDDCHAFIDTGVSTHNCAEIALRPKQMCNLTEVNLAACKTFEELVEAVRAATILGTLQASYTDFNYLDPKWRENCNEEALLGVSLTGLAENWGLLGNKWQVKYLASYMKAVNDSWAKKIGVNPAARLGCVKPSGTASAYLGTTSGIHAAHSPHFLRRVRIDVTHPVSRYLETVLSKDFLEKDVFTPSNYVVSIPIKMNGSITRHTESATQLLERMKFIADHWVHASHRSGVNKHNVSITVSYKPEEWNAVKEWMWDNRESYAGISLLPFSDHVYQQAPFEEIDEETYTKLNRKFPTVQFSEVNYSSHADDRKEEAACAGGVCDLI